MKRRIFAAVLAAAMVLSLAACGGGNGGGSASSNPGSSSAGGSGVSSSQPGGSSSDGSTPDGSETSGSAGGSASSSADGSSSAGDGASSSAGSGSSSSQGASISLNRTDVTLKTAGSSFNLRYTAEPTGVEVFFSSSDEKVATVDGKGTVTAVAPGTATITVTLGSELAQASCVVRCRWDDASSGGSSSSGSSSNSGSSSASKVDLSSFYTTVTGKYQFAFMMEADADTLNNFFSGLSDLTLSQQVAYLCGMSPSPNGDFVLVQVSDSKDVATVKSILQARIDYMVGDGNGPGGAFYPMEQTMWEENARIAVNGNYVMLIVHENCDDIVNDFNALF